MCVCACVYVYNICICIRLYEPTRGYIVTMRAVLLWLAPFFFSTGDTGKTVILIGIRRHLGSPSGCSHPIPVLALGLATTLHYIFVNTVPRVVTEAHRALVVDNSAYLLVGVACPFHSQSVQHIS
ncbi:hypothetical protein GGR52DRAFT_367957 [Hypoxylon sp. FL1284]|nr:hypothetical protein GGR52DRAFT_367957 [Hypoxylon sp. FL1284]